MKQDFPKETENVGKPADLIYGIDACPSFKEALFAALQHLLAIFVAIITPPLIIAGALKLDLETTGFLVSMSLFASGISTFVQCRGFGPVGARLLHTGNQFLLYRADYCCRNDGRSATDLRGLHGGCAHRDDYQPHLSLLAGGDYAVGVGHCGFADWAELD